MLNKLPLKLGHKLMIMIIITLLPPLMIVSFYFYDLMKTQVVSEFSKSQQSHLSFLKYYFERELVSFSNTAKIIAAEPALRKALDLENNLGLNSQLNWLISAYPEINYLILVDKQQQIFAINTIDFTRHKVPSESLLSIDLNGYSAFPAFTNATTFSAPSIDPFGSTFNTNDRYIQLFTTPVIVKGQTYGWLVVSFRWQDIFTDLTTSLKDDFNKQGQTTLGVAVTDRNDQIIAGQLVSKNQLPVRKLPFTIADRSYHLVIQSDSAMALESIEAQRNSVFGLIIPLSILMLALLYFVVYRTLITPIKTLKYGTDQYANGVLNYRIPVSGKDELAKLTASFNQMGDELHEARTNLESQVQQRTLSLTHANAQLAHAIESTTKANKIKSEFLNMMSHEIRTPMNGVLGMLTLMEETALNPKQSHYTHMAKSSAKFLLSLINDILDFSRIESGQLDLEIEKFDLEALFCDFTDFIAIQVEQKELELILNLTNTKNRVVAGDQGRLRQILVNLLSNAMKFTHQGEIHISVETKVVENLILLTCSVRDTGIGIAKSAQADLFESFNQVDNSTTRLFGGTGLGLAIVKQLCELMGGHISVESEEGQGSNFIFSIFLNNPDTNENELQKVDLTGHSILVIDDNTTACGVLAEALRNWGAEVFQCDGPTTALPLMQQHANHPFRFVFIDQKLKTTSGYQLAKTISQAQLATHSQLILLCSQYQQHDLAFLRNIGFSDIVNKPIYLSALAGKLKDLLQRDPQQISTNATPEHANHAKVPLLTGNVLLVEDNMINQIVARGMLENLGVKVTVACQGQHALELLKDTGPDNVFSLVVMDCQMPVMDGYQASRSIREGKAGFYNKDIVIIALTANAMHGDKELCLAAGMTDYMAKPVDQKSLLVKLEKYLL